MSKIQPICSYNANSKALFNKQIVSSGTTNRGIAAFNNIAVPLNTYKSYHLNNKLISFGSLFRENLNGYPLDTSFFRDVRTIKAANEALLEAFPEGTTVLDYACSSGEESLSLAMIMDYNKYKIIGLDMDPDAIKLAKKGIHSVFSGCSDSFLLDDERELTAEESYFKKQFKRFFYETNPPVKPLNNSIEKYNSHARRIPDFRIKYFEANDYAKEAVEFRSSTDGDILNVDNFEPNKKVGAIFFRNSFYHLTGNNILETLFYGYQYNRSGQSAIDEVVDNVHSRLEPGGIFVVGRHMKEHLFLAQKDVPDEEVIKYCDTSLFRNALHNLLSQRNDSDYEAAVTRLFGYANIRFLKKSPLEQALKKDGRFKPIHFEPLEGMPEVKVPTVWQKIA